jgi:O-antigen/teichoic acid export membrane protein
MKRNVVANVLGRFYAMGSVYFFVLFYVDILGVEKYGVIAFYTVLLTIGSIADVGLSATLSREAARENDKARLRDLAATMERVLLACTLLFALVIVVFAESIAAQWLGPGASVSQAELVTSLRLMALMIPAQMGFSLYSAGLLNIERQVAANAILVAFVTVRGGLVIPLLYFTPSLTVFFTWQLVATVIFFMLARAIMMRAIGFNAFSLGRPSLATLQPLWGFAGGAFLFTLLSAVNSQIDKLVVSKSFPIETFGYYSLASTLSLLPAAVVGPLIATLLPRLTRMIADGDETGASTLLSRFARLIAALSGLGAVGLAFFAPEIFSIWLGSEHTSPEIVTVARILAGGGLFLALTAVPYYLGLAHGHNRTSVVVGASTMLLTIPLLVFATERFGLVGAAWPWLLANVLAFSALMIIVAKRYYRGSLVRLLLLSIVTPILGCALLLSAARLVADWFQAGPFLSCAIAGVFGLVALALATRAEIRSVMAPFLMRWLKR